VYDPHVLVDEIELTLPPDYSEQRYQLLCAGTLGRTPSEIQATANSVMSAGLAAGRDQATVLAALKTMALRSGADIIEAARWTEFHAPLSLTSLKEWVHTIVSTFAETFNARWHAALAHPQPDPDRMDVDAMEAGFKPPLPAGVPAPSLENTRKKRHAVDPDSRRVYAEHAAFRRMNKLCAACGYPLLSDPAEHARRCRRARQLLAAAQPAAPGFV